MTTSPLNILISSAGRRIGLIDCFRHALRSVGAAGDVFAIDCSPTAPAFHYVTKSWLVPPCTQPGFTEIVLGLAVRHDIRLIVPTIDTELPAYARHAGRFLESGVRVCISAPLAVEICADKRLTNSWLNEHGFQTVRQALPDAILRDPSGWKFPLIAKPRRGSASIGLARLASLEQLKQLSLAGDDVVVEEQAPGIEHTVNVFVDRSGRCLCAIPHRRLEVRAGEVSKGVTVKHRAMMQIARDIAETLPGAYGALNIQCFLSDDERVRVIEMNARFGGGYPLAHQAGAHFARWLLDELLGCQATDCFDGWQDDLAMLRYDAAIFLRGDQIRKNTNGDRLPGI